MSADTPGAYKPDSVKLVELVATVVVYPVAAVLLLRKILRGEWPPVEHPD